MTGNYGGEVLRHVVAFKAVEPHAGVFRSELSQHFQRARETYRSLLACHPVSFAAFRQMPWHHYGLLALEQTQVAMRSPFLDNEIVRVAYRAPAPALESNDACLRLIADGNPALRAIATDRGPIAGGPWGAARRAAAEFMRLSEYAYDYGMPQWLVPVDRRLAGLRPERLFLGRQKFFHFRLWYRDVLAGYVRDILLDPRALSRPYVDRRHVETLVRDHVAGRANHTLDIHKLLTLELVHRLFVDHQSARHVSAADRCAITAA
jgi:asparagine synthase (glutamine-hydrolysing)